MFLGIAVVDSNEFSTVYIFSQQTVMVIEHHYQQYVSYIGYSSPEARLELPTLVVIGTDCIGNCKSN